MVDYKFTTHYVDRKYVTAGGPSGVDVNGVLVDGTGKPIAMALWGARGKVADINATANGDHKKQSDFAAAYPDSGKQTGTDLGIEIGGLATSCPPTDPRCNPVPEPATMVLLGTGLVGMIGYGWRRKQSA